MQVNKKIKEMIFCLIFLQRECAIISPSGVAISREDESTWRVSKNQSATRYFGPLVFGGGGEPQTNIMIMIRPNDRTGSQLGC